MTQFRIVQLAYLKAMSEWALAVQENERNPENKFWEFYRSETWEELQEIQKIYAKEIEKNG